MSTRDMTPREILANLADDSDQRAEAALELIALLTKLAKGALYEPLSQEVYFINLEQQEEIVDQAVERVIRFSPLPVVEKPDGTCVNYLKRILARLAIDEGRKRKLRNEVVLVEGSVEDVSTEAKETSDDERRLIEESKRLLARVVDDTCDNARNDRERESQRRAWSQIELLVHGEADMADILERDEGISGETSKDELKRARDRVLTQHKRFRERLGPAIDRMQKSGALSEEESELARQLVERFLLRRQKKNNEPSTDM